MTAVIDKLREVPGCGDEAGAGGHHGEEEGERETDEREQ